MVNDIRLARLAEVVKERASRAILYELKDPRLGFVTVTRVKLARDLTQCVVFWSVMGTPGEQSKTAHALEDARGFIQSAIAKVMGTKKTPRIYLRKDESLEKAHKVFELLAKLKRERGETGPATTAPDPTSEE